ncbi:MAG TPA: glycosyltransferase [Rectinema sp.]|nr:glycosyltransferase [Rectinema sp.]
MKIAICMMRCLGVGYGSVKAAVNLANELVKRNNDVSFLCYDETQEKLEFKLDPRVYFFNLAKVRPVRLLKVSKIIIKILYNIPSILPFFLYKHIGESLYQLRWFIQENIAPVWAWKIAFNRGGYDVVSVHGSDAISIVPFAVNTKRTKLIITLHSRPQAEIEGFSLNKIIFRAKVKGLNRANKITVLQKKFIAEARGYCQDTKKLVYIPNFIYEFTRDRHKHIGNHVNIIAIGNLVKEKNFDILIQALAIVRSDNWSCDIWGKDCGEKETLKKMIEKNKLENRVFLKGFTNSIEKEIEKAHVIIQPSLFEGFPLAVSEAMARGVVPIGFSSCSGINDLISDHYNGLLSKENDAAGLARLIDYLIGNPELYVKLSRNAVESIRKYNPESIMPEWEKLIHE